MEEVVDGGTLWRFDVDFLESNWACIWGRGCLGIRAEAAPELGHGCCSMGADFEDEDEARLIGALGATLDPDRFQYHAEASAEGVYGEPGPTSTRIIDGACIFLNRPGFSGGAGCALHLAALDAGEPPLEWKPAVCWQLPIKVDWEPADGDTEVATLRRWTRADWGGEGVSMAWCCTEGERAYVGDRPVIETLADELEAIIGPEVLSRLRQRIRLRGRQ